MGPTDLQSAAHRAEDFELPNLRDGGKRWSLRQQVLAGMLVLTVLISLGAAQAISYFEAGYLKRTTMENGDETLSILKSTALEAIISEDAPVLQSLAQQLVKHDHRIKAVVFANENGQVLARAGVIATGLGGDVRRSAYYFQQNVTFDGENFGDVDLVVDLSDEHKRIRQHALIMAGLSALVLSLTTILIYGGLTFSVMRPIRKLDEIVRGYSRGMLNEVPSVPARAAAEIHCLSRSVAALGEAARLHKKRSEELLVAKQDAERANQAKSDFLAKMSHELRTPVNAIVGFADMINHELLGPLNEPRYKEYAELILRAGIHLTSMISDILDLSRVEAGKIDLDETSVAISTLTGDAAQMLSDAASKKNSASRRGRAAGRPASLRPAPHPSSPAQPHWECREVHAGGRACARPRPYGDRWPSNDHCFRLRARHQAGPDRHRARALRPSP